MNQLCEHGKYIIPPGETILELLEVYSMSMTELANKIGVDKELVDNIITGNVAITRELAIKLENIFNISASFWNNLEDNYQKIKKRLA